MEKRDGRGLLDFVVEHLQDVLLLVDQIHFPKDEV
jgi:hypothetical protein